MNLDQSTHPSLTDDLRATIRESVALCDGWGVQLLTESNEDVVNGRGTTRIVGYRIPYPASHFGEHAGVGEFNLEGCWVRDTMLYEVTTEDT